MKKQVPDITRINKLSNIYKTVNKKAEFLLVPTGEFESNSDDYFTKSLIDSLQTGYPIVKFGKTKKGSANQSPLFKFLTDKDLNGKFNVDVEVPWQMFALTESGKLYAVMLGVDDIESGRLLEILNAKTN